MLRSPFAELRASRPHAYAVGHVGEVSDIVEAVLYLGTAGFVTGEVLHVGAATAPVIDTTPEWGWTRVPGTSEGTPMPIMTIQVTREGSKPGVNSVTAE
jgi:hypothetical protein